jgi:hypothetical protein
MPPAAAAENHAIARKETTFGMSKPRIGFRLVFSTGSEWRVGAGARHAELRRHVEGVHRWHREARRGHAELSRHLYRLKRFRAKWMPVRVKKTRQNKNLELIGSDLIRTDKL